MTAILYASKSGAARECAEALAARLGSCQLFDLAAGVPELAPFDRVIVGSGVRMGKVYKPVAKLLAKGAPALAGKQVAFYFCNTYEENYTAMLEKNLPADLAGRALCVASFGGRPPFSKAPAAEWMKTEALGSFASCINGEAVAE